MERGMLAPLSPNEELALRRIARGSGTNVQAVSQLVKQFGQMRKVMKQVASGKMPSLQQLAGGR